jgi:hypothetical protein
MRSSQGRPEMAKAMNSAQAAIDLRLYVVTTTLLIGSFRRSCERLD